MDRVSISPGDEWDPALVEALSETRILVCLLSQRYLTSEYCGKEFGVFHARVRDHVAQQSDGRRPRLIMPVHWHPRRQLLNVPDVIMRIQYGHDEYGELYRKKGLSVLARQGRYQDDYQQFLDAFTWQIVDAVREYPLPPAVDRPSLAEAENVFRMTGDPADNHLPVGPTSVRFIFVAARRDEIAGVRNQTKEYGSDLGREWSPFPASSVGALSSGVVSRKNLFPEDLLINTDIIQRIRDAEAANSIVLLIVDPWSVQLPRYQEFLQNYDRERFLNSGVIVLWNPDDEQTVSNEPSLKATLRQTILRTYNEQNYVRDSVRGADQFETELVRAVDEIHRRLRSRGPVFHLLGTNGGTPLPQLAGPGGEQ